MSLVQEIITKADSVVTAITPFLNRIVVALIILFLGFIIGKLLGRILFRLLQDFRIDANAKRILRRPVPLRKWISSLVSFVIYFIAVIMALNALGLTTAVLTILFAVVIIVIGISFLIAIKDLVPNLMAGFSIRQKELFSEGDTILFEGIEGKVEGFSLTETRVRRKNGDLLIIPNSFFPKQAFVKKKARRKKR